MRTKETKRTARPVTTIIFVSASVIIAGCGTGAEDIGLAAATTSVALHINEFMADNDTAVADPDGIGGHPDWLEIYNASDEAIDMGGMYLTDDLNNPTKWRVPDGLTIPAGGHLLFWADEDQDQGDSHTNFKLAKAGEEIGLFETDARGNATIDTVTFSAQTPDVSLGRFPDGAEGWQPMIEPTPGQTNTTE